MKYFPDFIGTERRGRREKRPYVEAKKKEVKRDKKPQIVKIISGRVIGGGRVIENHKEMKIKKCKKKTINKNKETNLGLSTKLTK